MIQWMKRLTHLLVLYGLTSTVCGQVDNFKPILSTSEKQDVEAGELVMRDVESQYGDGMSVETIGLMSASGETLYNILTDFQAYPQFMSALDSINILTADQDTTTLNYILNPMLGVVKRYRVKITSQRVVEKVWKIQWDMLEWPGLTSLETIGDTKGYWLIIEESPNRSLVQYYVYTNPGPLPFGFSSIVNALGKRSVEDVFMETRAKAEGL